MLNILNNCTIYYLNLQNINNSKVLQFLKDKYKINDDEEDLLLKVYGNVIEEIRETFNYNDIYQAIEYDFTSFDENLLEDTLTNLIGSWPQYLVIAKSVRWNGTSGYGIFKDIKQTVYRNDDISLYLVKEIPEKAIICRESSHDVPLGSNTYIIGISNEDAEKMDYMDFDEIEEFARNICDE